MRVFLILAMLTLAAGAQTFTEGQPIEYESSRGVWEPGVFVRETPEGKQYIIREKPSQFFPEGSQAAWAKAQVRPRGAAPQPVQTEAPPAEPPTAVPAGRGLMNEQEVLSFLRGRLGGHPWGPNRAQAVQELADQIKARGLSFHFLSTTPFYQEIAKFGADSTLSRPLSDNFGPPPQRSELLGTWRTEINAPATYFTVGNDVWRHHAKVAKAGSITLSANAYAWTLATGQTVHGKWRPATAAEMQTAGGEGLVLSQGKSGFDWIVTKYRDETPPGQPTWITIAEITTRQEREFGSR